MKTLLTYLALFITTTTIAQQTPIKVTGSWCSECRVFNLSKNALQKLFVAEKGNVMLSEQADYFKLSAADAQKNHQNYLIVIPSNGYDESNKHGVDTLTLYPLFPAEGVYYTKKQEKTGRSIYYLDHPSLKDTVSMPPDSKDLTNTQKWIDNLDNQHKVTLQSIMNIETSTGPLSEPIYDRVPISEFAKAQMHYVYNLFDAETSDDWTKSQWEEWFKNKMAYTEKEQTFSDFGIPLQVQYILIGPVDRITIDPFSKRIYRIGYTGGNKWCADLDSIPLVRILDSDTTYRYSYCPNKHPHATDLVAAFEVLHDTIYTMTQTFQWREFCLDKAPINAADSLDGHYRILSTKDLLPPSLQSQSPQLVHSYSNANVMYCTLQAGNDIYALSVNTKTGNVINLRSMQDIFKDTKHIPSEGNIVFGMGSCQDVTKTQNKYIFVIAPKNDDTNDQVVCLDDHLNLVHTMVTNNRELLFANAVVDDNQIRFFYCENEPTELVTATIDRNFLSIKTKITFPKDTADFISGVVAKKEGDKTFVFYQYASPSNRGIKCVIMNDKNQIISSHNVYSYIPIEEESSENTVHMEYIAHTNDGWHVFFRKGGSYLHNLNAGQF